MQHLWTMPGQQYAGDFVDKFSARAGFVWKLGKVTKPNLISMNDKKALQSKIENLASSNKNIKEDNKELKELIAKQNKRLEKLERIALGEQKEQDLASKF